MLAERLTDRVAYHGEGAFWDDREQRLRFVDMLAGDVVTLLPTGTVTRRHLGDVAAVIRGREDGGYVVAVEHSVLLLTEDWTLERSVRLLRDPAVRLNEGGCSPDGDLYIGSMAYDASDEGGILYRIDARAFEGSDVLPTVSIPNGLVWSADGGYAFHNDTGPGTLTRYRFSSETGALEDPQVLVRFDEDGGAPDGMAIDEDGGLWVALWGGGAVHRYSPDGQLDAVVEVSGATNVTSCTFGGADRRTLYITTSLEGVDADEEPAAGSLFAVETAVAGAPLARYRG